MSVAKIILADDEARRRLIVHDFLAQKGCALLEVAGMAVFWLGLPADSRDALPKEGPGRN